MRNHIIKTAFLTAIVFTACTKQAPRENGEPVAVAFSASLQDLVTAGQAYKTSADGSQWLAGDAVGIFMIQSDRTIEDDRPGDTPANHNRKYTVSDSASGALTLADEKGPLYYLNSGAVDFIAYYPFASELETGHDGSTVRTIDLTDQSSVESIDALYAKTTGVAKSNAPVNLSFGHVFTKITLKVRAGNEVSPSSVTALTSSDVGFNGFPGSVELTLQSGTTRGKDFSQTIHPLAETVPQQADYQAAFSAILCAEADSEPLSMSFYVQGEEYVCILPPEDELLPGVHYLYTVTVQKTAVEIGDPAIAPWDRNDHGSHTGTPIRLMPLANSYMLTPHGPSILLPIEQANEAADPAKNLGASTDGLGGVNYDNWRVELLWSDKPLGHGAVIEKMRDMGYEIMVTPGEKGNAVICIRDEQTDEIKWSWHIWVTEPVGSQTDPATGLTWMDRNLGAYENGWNDDLQNGLYYQWGRKDAFPGAGQYFSVDYPQGTHEEIATHDMSELPEMVRNPLTFASNPDSYFGSVNITSNNPSWMGLSGEKTIYDPCPAGWRVPPLQVGSTFVWGISTDTDNEEWTSSYTDQVLTGMTFQGVGGAAGLGHYYPMAGYRTHTTGRLTSMQTEGYWWSAASGPDFDNSASNLFISKVAGVFTQDQWQRGNGMQIRCVKE